MKFNAKIVGNAIRFANKEYLNNFLKGMPDGQYLVIDIEKRKRLRSNQQNAMYWAYVIPAISSETGHTHEELHFFFKRKFLPKQYIKIGNTRILAEPSTTKLTTKEFMDYVEQIMVWSAQELGMEWNMQG